MTTTKQRKQRLNELADRIELDAQRFNYASWLRRRVNNDPFGGMFVSDAVQVANEPEALCNTVGCIAGWAAVQGVIHGYIPRGFTKADMSDMPLPQYAASYLGLDQYEAHSLFMGHAMIESGLYDEDSDVDDIMEQATAAEAAKLLRMIANDEVPGFRKPVKKKVTE